MTSAHGSMQSSMDSSDVPSAAVFTSSPLRNRIRVELDAPVPEVRELMGDLDATKATIDEALADIAENLIGRFGGKVMEKYVE